MVETLHKKFYGTDRQYPIIPQEQRQKTNTYVLELPGTKKKKKKKTERKNQPQHPKYSKQTVRSIVACTVFAQK